MCTCLYMCIDLYVYVCVNMYIYIVDSYVHADTHMYKCGYMRIYTNMLLYIYICICMYIYIYMHAQTHMAERSRFGAVGCRVSCCVSITLRALWYPKAEDLQWVQCEPGKS